jgi:hypothetical protein
MIYMIFSCMVVIFLSSLYFILWYIKPIEYFEVNVYQYCNSGKAKNISIHTSDNASHRPSITQPASIPAQSASLSITQPASIPAQSTSLSITQPASIPAQSASLSITQPAPAPAQSTSFRPSPAPAPSSIYEMPNLEQQTEEADESDETE